MDNNNTPPDEASGDAIHRPQPAHIREETDSDEEWEATELRQIDPDDNPRPHRLSRVITPNKPAVRWYDPIKKFWRHEVRISVPHEDCRDHLGK